MLVWYDEKYPQYLGIPGNIFDLGAVAANGKCFERRKEMPSTSVIIFQLRPNARHKILTFLPCSFF